MLKILQVSLQQFVNWELPHIQAGFRKGTRNQRSNYQHLLDHRESKGIPENIYFCFIDYIKVTVYHSKLWKILQEVEIQDYLTYLLRNLFAGQEATVRTRHVPIDLFQIGKGVRQGWILSPCLFNSYAEYIMWSVRLDESQRGIKIAGRNSNNFIYADDITLMS